jgi:hypothetical protein
MLIPIILFVVLVAVVIVANSRRKSGQMSDAAYSRVVSGASVAVTIAALAVLFMRLKG